MKNVAPPPALLTARTPPPCAVMIEWLIANPSPSPCIFVVTKGSNSRCCISGTMPLPLSVTPIRTDQSSLSPVVIVNSRT